MFALIKQSYTPCSMYLLWDKKTKEGAIVDPFDPRAIVSKAKQLGVKITSVLTTHSHNDHDGGNPTVARMVHWLRVKHQPDLFQKRNTLH